MTTSLPILYSFRRCPYAMRARLALASAGIAYELREIQLRHKPHALLAASPKGTVPVLVLPTGQVLDESLDIMLYALRQQDPEGWLLPTQGSLQDMLALIAHNDQHFKPALDRCKYHERYLPQEVAQAQRDATAWLDTLERQLHATGYLFGQHPSLADMALRPFVRQFARADEAAWHRGPWPQVQAWLQRWLDSALFAQVMQRAEVWREPERLVPQALGHRHTATACAPARPAPSRPAAP